jgi:hypothetical protein
MFATFVNKVKQLLVFSYQRFVATRHKTQIKGAFEKPSVSQIKRLNIFLQEIFFDITF